MHNICYAYACAKTYIWDFMNLFGRRSKAGKGTEGRVLCCFFYRKKQSTNSNEWIEFEQSGQLSNALCVQRTAVRRGHNAINRSSSIVTEMVSGESLVNGIINDVCLRKDKVCLFSSLYLSFAYYLWTVYFISKLICDNKFRLFCYS